MEWVDMPQAPREWGVGEGIYPSPLGEGSGERAVPTPRKCFVFLVENTILRRILTRLFLKSYASGRGSNPS